VPAEPGPPPLPAGTPWEGRCGPVALTSSAKAALWPLPLGAVRITGGLWATRQQRNREVSLPHAYEQLEARGNLDNLRRAAARSAGPHRGPRFSDSDVYKWLEAMYWDRARDPGSPLGEEMAATVDLVGRAQEGDGYLNSYYSLAGTNRRFSDWERGHELYCAGHLIQSGIAAVRATGERRLLGIALNFAYLLARDLAPGGPLAGSVPGHPGIETALVELYRETSEGSFLELACQFLEGRGHRRLVPGSLGSSYFQDGVPVRRSRTVVGHAVRALYLAVGITDAYLETGDEEYLAAARAQWEDMTAAKSYLTGGVGARHDLEAFGEAYELPPDRAYCETCAAIAVVLWSWRLLLATGEASYADHIERVLHNAVAAGVSLDGRSYAYVNPLQVRSGHVDEPDEPDPVFRRPWFECACCPPNLMRLVASLQAYVATQSDRGLQLHQYLPARVRVHHRSWGTLGLTIATAYPWDGSVVVEVLEPGAGPWELATRIPGWCSQARFWTPDGDGWKTATPGSYLRVFRSWEPGDRLELDLGVAAHLVTSHPRIDATRGCVAIERGPLVYCVEEEDLPEGTLLDDVALDPAAPLTPGTPVRGGRLEEAVTVGVSGVVRTPSWEGHWPYRTANGDDHVEPAPLAITAIPYYAWNNRGPSPMRVWLPTWRTG
jgi:DUF1680 family protein